MKFRSFVVLALASPLFGAYSYYMTDHLNLINTGQWTQNGSLSAAPGVGLTSSTAGSLISSVAVPTPAASYEVKLTLSNQNSVGSYVAYLRASTNALLTQTTATGTFYAVQVSPNNNGRCTVSLVKVVSGSSASNLSSTTVGGCNTGTVVRTVIEPNTTIIVYVNNVQILSYNDFFSIASGQPGIGVMNASGNSITLAELGQFDGIAPNAV